MVEAFAAWASLMKEESNLRLVFALLTVITLAAGTVQYLNVPAVVA